MDSIKAPPSFAKQWYTSDLPLLAVKYHATDKP